MKKALFIVALYLVPFLSVKADIFTDGTVDLQAPKVDSFFDYGDGRSSTDAAEDNCKTIPNSIVIEGHILSENETTQVYKFKCQYTVSGGQVYKFKCQYTVSGGQVYDNGWVTVSGLKNTRKQCPPNGFPTYVAPKIGQTEDDFMCFDPAQANREDSCNASSGNEYLTIAVSAPSGCFPQSDGSICKYDAVDVGGGNQYYALDLEGDCYSENDLPDLNGTPQDNPVGDECVNYGQGVLGCPEDPSNVCSSGSAYAGGSINDCNEGCGMVNDQFLCIDQDTDGDGLPDYNDPDIDGDGVPNKDDLDSDGDGKDDPKDSGGVGKGGSSIDLGPVVKELKKLNKQFESQGKPDDIDKDDKLKKKNDDYKKDLEALRDKSAEEMGYVDSLSLDSSAGLVASLPDNSCKNYAFHPAGHSITLDTCVVADKIRPILAWLFGMLTAWHIFFLINKTLREGV